MTETRSLANASLAESLEAREREGRPVRAGRIGVGQRGTAILVQTGLMLGIEVVEAADDEWERQLHRATAHRVVRGRRDRADGEREGACVAVGPCLPGARVTRARRRAGGASRVPGGASPPGVARGGLSTILLPGEAPVELASRGGRERRIGDRIVFGASGRPQWRTAGGRGTTWRRRLAEVGADVAHGCRRGDEGDDAHRAATAGTHGWEHFMDAGERLRPGIAGGATVGRFGGGWIVPGDTVN